MKDIIISFWVNILSSIAFGVIAAIIAIYPLGIEISYSLGIGVLVLFIILSGTIIIRRRKDMNKNSDENASSSGKKINSKSINRSVVVQANNSNVNVEQIHGNKTIFYNFAQTTASLEPTTYTKFHKIKDLKAKFDSLSFSALSEFSELITLTFVSKKWGFRFQMNIPWDMQCGMLAQLLVEGLGLQEHLKIEGERVGVMWQIESEQGDLCDGRGSIRSLGIKDGETFYLRATVMRRDVMYDLGPDGKPAGMYIPPPREIENWLA